MNEILSSSVKTHHEVLTLSDSLSTHTAEKVIIIPVVAQSPVTNKSFPNMELNEYAINKYGDEYAYEDELGFETSYMGPRADHNHIF